MKFGTEFFSNAAYVLRAPKNDDLFFEDVYEYLSMQKLVGDVAESVFDIVSTIREGYNIQLENKGQVPCSYIDSMLALHITYFYYGIENNYEVGDCQKIISVLKDISEIKHKHDMSWDRIIQSTNYLKVIDGGKYK